MSSDILCGPCGRTDKHGNAQEWCYNCMEGVCHDCEQVHRYRNVTRDHKLIPIDDFHEIENDCVNMKCDKHGKVFHLYCKTHDVAICVDCLPSQHKHCNAFVISIHEAAKNAKRSTAFEDLDDSIGNALDAIKHFNNSCNAAGRSIELQEQTVKKSIREMRFKINKKLDEIEKKMLDELSEQYGNCKSKYTEVLNQVNKMDKKIQGLREQTSQLKHIGSNIKVFLRTLQLNKLIQNEVQTVKLVTTTMQEYKFGVEIHPRLISLVNDVDNFGKIKVDEKTMSLPFKDAKVGQAQMVQIAADQSFNRTRLQLRQKFKLNRKNNVCACTVLQNGQLLIANVHSYVYSEIMEYNEDGRHIRDIPVPGKLFDLTVIDNNRIAVTYGNHMMIMDIENNRVDTKITFERRCLGISYENKIIYALVVNEGIVKFDTSGNRLHTADCKFIDPGNVFCITTTKDRIHCTDYYKNEIYCCSMTGKYIWTFTDKFPVDTQGISADSEHNLFVVGRNSNHLIMIKHNGTVSKVLLTESDGLNNPVPVHYNRDNKLLLICNESNEDAFLYSVV
ncbi:uncharacterized protein [Mytilus edulis]|uniref:uncharacterized protein n=1 Tax=Mytilus edulis TaxID=6550 RepID=UPI0039F0384D